MYCPGCNTEYKEGEAYCKNCGAKLNTSGAASSSEQALQSYMSGGQQNQRPYPPVRQKDYFSFPRIVALLGVIIYAICEFNPQIYYYVIGGDIYSVSMYGLSVYCLAVPVLMAYNALFDRGKVIGVSFSGVKGGYLKFKLCILFGLVGMCVLAIIPATVLPSKLGEGTVEFTSYYYAAWVGCVLTIIAPFLIRENDGTGITPVKGGDFVWIIIAAGITAFICYRAIDMVYIFVDNEYAASDYAEDISESADSGVSEGDSASAADGYTSALSYAIDYWHGEYPDMQCCLYDMNNDGTDDLIFYEYSWEESCDTYDILIYSKNDGGFNYISTLYSDGSLYGCSKGGVYVYVVLNDDERGYFYWSYNGSEMVVDDDLYSENNLVATASGTYKEPAYNIYGDVWMYEDSAFTEAVEEMRANRLKFIIYSQIDDSFLNSAKH